LWQEGHDDVLPWKGPAGQQSFAFRVQEEAGFSLYLESDGVFVVQTVGEAHKLLEGSKIARSMQIDILDVCVEAHNPDEDVIV